MFLLSSPAAFSPAAPAGRAVAAPLQSAPSMGFGKAELAGAYGRLALCTSELLPHHEYRAPETPRSCTPTLCAPEAHPLVVACTALAKEQNPVVGYWDPMGLADVPLWNQDEEAVIGAHCHTLIFRGPSSTGVHTRCDVSPWVCQGGQRRAHVLRCPRRLAAPL